jgi:hypothetical protein
MKSKNLLLAFTIYIFSLSTLALHSFSQSSTPIKTDIFWLNLCTPNELTSVTKPKGGRGRYEIKWKNNLSFGLTNINQFKYDYKINSIPFAAFVDSNYGGFTNSLSAIIDLTNNPYFNFVIKAKSPNKEVFKKLTSTFDSALNAYKRVKGQMRSFQMDFPVYDDLKKNKEAFKKYKELDEQGKELNELIIEVKNKLNAIPYDQQVTALKGNFYNLRPIEFFLFDTITPATIVTESYYNNYYTNTNNSRQFVSSSSIDEYQLGFNGEKPDYVLYINQLLSLYQQNVEYIRTLMSQFEVSYEKERNYLISSQCKNYDTNKKEKLDSLIKMFIKARNSFIQLSDLYAISPVQDDYLEGYLATEQQFSEKLFSQFTGLLKIINVDTTYITPTTSNMKNFDLIRIELDKTDKTNQQSEKYDYDIFLKGGLKIDFSAGIFGSFLKNDEYIAIDSLDNNNKPTDKKMIKVKDQGKLNVGFGGLVNVTVRSGASWFAPGFSFGFIVDSKPSLQFLSSLTLAMGKSERLLLHAGYAVGFVKRIDGLELNKYIPTVTIGNAVPTTDKILAKPFFGLSYNLSKNNVFKATTFATAASSTSSGNQ